MLEEQTVHEGKDEQRGRGSGTPLGFRLGRKELTLGGNKGEREGGRMQREGASLPHCRGKCCFWGSSGGLLLCQIYVAAEPHSALAPMLITGRKPEPRGEAWGKGQYPR